MDHEVTFFVTARLQADAHTESSGVECFVFHSPDGPGYEWDTAHTVKAYRREVWEDDIVYSTREGMYES